MVVKNSPSQETNMTWGSGKKNQISNLKKNEKSKFYEIETN